MGLLDPQALEYFGLLGQSMLAGQSPNAGVNIGNAMMYADTEMRRKAAEKARLEEERQQAKMRDMQMQKLLREEKFNQVAFTPGQAPVPFNDAMGDGSGGMIPGQGPQFNYGAAAAVDPMRAWQLQREMTKSEAPQILAPGAAAFDPRTKQRLYGNEKPPELPAGMRMGANGPEWIPGYLEGKGKVAAQGAARVDVKYGGSMASELGKGTAAVLTTGRDKAESAVESIKQGHQILQTLDAGPSYVGPGASIKLKAAQIAPMLGFKPDDAGLRNTRELIVGLANQTLNSRGLLKGQGQITEYEQKTLQKAKSGEIDDMTADEIRALVRVNERASRAQIANHARLVGSLGKNQQYSEALPFFQIDEPPQYSAPQSGGFKYLGPEGK